MLSHLIGEEKAKKKDKTTENKFHVVSSPHLTNKKTDAFFQAFQEIQDTARLWMMTARMRDMLAAVAWQQLNQALFHTHTHNIFMELIIKLFFFLSHL